MLSAILTFRNRQSSEERCSTLPTVETQRHQMLARNLMTTLIVSVLNASIIAILLSIMTRTPGIWFWYAAMVAVSLFRVVYVMRMAEQKVRLDAPKINIIAFFTFIAGILWGSLPLLFGTQVSATMNNLIIFVIAGMSAGACIAFATHIRLVIAFNFPALVLLIAHFSLFGETIAYAMCATLILYFIITLGLAQNTSEAVENALHNQAIAERQRVELLEKKKFLDAEVVARLQTESQLTRALTQSRMFNQALEQIFNAYTENDRTTEKLVREITEQIAEAMRINRVGVWAISKDKTAFESVDIYDSARNAHQSNPPILIADCSDFFEAVSAKQIVAAQDAQTDIRTSQLGKDYLRPNHIRSKLDAPIYAANSLWGIISCETTGEFHEWTSDEIAFVSSAAQFISMSLLADESERLTKELKSALITAEEASAAKSEFLATMSHEIRTPMNGVIGAGSILSKMDLTADMRSFVSIINDSASSLLYLLNNILDLSKLEAGRMDFEEAPFELNEVIEKVVAVHSLKAIEKSITFDVAIAREVSNSRIGDSHRIIQVLHNLLSNAIKFTHEGGVTLSIEETTDENEVGNGILIDVSDTGIGMTKAQVDRIFDAFTQADSSTTREYGGTGLGVSIIEGIVTAMGGKIEVKSAPGKGSSFKIAVPLKTNRKTNKKPDGARTARTMTALKGANILVADDNATNGLIMDAFLRRFHAKPSIVEDGKAAVEARKTNKFKLILMDINMPVMNGVSAFDEIRAFEKEKGLEPVPVVAVTADAMNHQVKTYLNHGFDGHLAKPVNEDRLLDAIERTLFGTAHTNTTRVVDPNKKRA